MAGSLAANTLRAAYQHQNRGMGFTLHSTLTLPWTAWRRVVSLTHGMTNSLTQQQMCYRMVGQEKCATWSKHVRLQEQTKHGWLLSLMWWFWIMQSVSTWLVNGSQSNTQVVWHCKVLVDSLFPQIHAMSPNIMPDLSKQSCRNFQTSVARVTCNKKQVTVRCDKKNRKTPRIS